MTLGAEEREFLADARRATLATTASNGRPRLVPVCFVVVDGLLWSPLDEKPKAVEDPRRLARIRDIARDPRVTLLVDRWSEDWSQLAWLRVDGHAELVDSDPTVVAALRAKYPQYAAHDLESRPMIRIQAEATHGWTALPSDRDAARRAVE